MPRISEPPVATPGVVAFESLFRSFMSHSTVHTSHNCTLMATLDSLIHAWSRRFLVGGAA